MKTLELIHCYQHLLANPAKICWAHLCTQSLHSAHDVCLVNIHSPPASLRKLLGIRWLPPNNDCHEHETTCLPLLCPLSAHHLVASFENVCTVSLSVFAGPERILRRFYVFAEEPCKSTITTSEPCSPVFKEAQPRP